MIGKVFAAIGLAVCVLLFVRLLISASQRYRLDMSLRAMGRKSQRMARATQQAAVAAWHWPGARRASKKAAAEAIQRARGGVTREGNVYKPKSFRKPPRDKMH
jgi:hypothetical protein